MPKNIYPQICEITRMRCCRRGAATADKTRKCRRRSEYGAETYRRREVNAPGLQENQQMDDDDRADPGGNREHEREKTENQCFIVYP